MEIDHWIIDEYLNIFVSNNLNNSIKLLNIESDIDGCEDEIIVESET